MVKCHIFVWIYSGIYKYNIDLNEWDFTPITVGQFGRLPLIQRITLFAFDKITKELYIGGCSYNTGKLLKLKADNNNNVGNVKVESLRYIEEHYASFNDSRIMENIKCLYIDNNILHLIGPNSAINDQSIYSIWNTKKKKLIQSESFVNNGLFWIENHLINPIFIKSQNKVLVFSKQTGNIWSYNFGLKIWKELKNGLLIPKCLRYKEYQVNITMDERYILFMPQMIIFDLLTFKFYGNNGDIKLPSNDIKDDKK